MPITVQKQRARPATHRVDLGVSVSGNSLTIRAGTFVLSKREYTLEADRDFTVQPSATGKTVAVYLVEDAAHVPSVVLIDSDHAAPAAFNMGKGNRMLHMLVAARLDADQSLEFGDVSVFHIVAPEPPSAPSPPQE